MKISLNFLSVVNMAIRLAGIAGRFALAIFLARFFSLNIVGIYGLIGGVTATLPPIIGFGLNYYLNRETIGHPPEECGPLIRDRLLITCAALAVTGILAFIYIYFRNPSMFAMLATIAPIIVLETIFVDIQLSLFSLKMPLLANTLLFIRSALWNAPFIFISYLEPDRRNLTFLMEWWFVGQVLAFALLAMKLRHWPWKVIIETPVNSGWIISRINAAKRIYLGDIGLAGYAYIDRFIVAALIGLEQTGIYVFLLSIAFGLQAMITSGIIQIALPHLVDAYKNKGYSEWKVMLGQLIRRVATFAIIGSVLLFGATLVLLPWLHRPGLQQHLGLLAATLIGSTIKLLSDLISYGLYSRKQDKALGSINILGLFLTIFNTVFFLKLFGLSGLSFSIVLTPSLMLLLRLFFLFPGPLIFGNEWLRSFLPTATTGWEAPAMMSRAPLQAATPTRDTNDG
jgi:O-antigen/teichoic acid export membrane protein